MDALVQYRLYLSLGGNQELIATRYRELERLDKSSRTPASGNGAAVQVPRKDQ